MRSDAPSAAAFPLTPMPDTDTPNGGTGLTVKEFLLRIDGNVSALSVKLDNYITQHEQRHGSEAMLMQRAANDPEATTLGKMLSQSNHNLTVELGKAEKRLEDLEKRNQDIDAVARAQAAEGEKRRDWSKVIVGVAGGIAASVAIGIFNVLAAVITHH